MRANRLSGSAAVAVGSAADGTVVDRGVSSNQRAAIPRRWDRTKIASARDDSMKALRHQFNPRPDVADGLAAGRRVRRVAGGTQRGRISQHRPAKPRQTPANAGLRDARIMHRPCTGDAQTMHRIAATLTGRLRHTCAASPLSASLPVPSRLHQGRNGRKNRSHVSVFQHTRPRPPAGSLLWRKPVCHRTTLMRVSGRGPTFPTDFPHSLSFFRNRQP